MKLANSIKKVYADAQKKDFFALLTLVTFIGFIISLLIVYFLSMSRSLAVMLISSGPLLLSVLMYYIDHKFEIKRWLERLLKLLMLSVITILSIGNLLFLISIECFDAVEFPMNNPAEYERIMSAYRYIPKSSPDIFPAKIPPEAKNVSLHANPPLLQGGESVQLSFDAPSDVIQTYKNQCVGKAQYILKIAEAKKWEYHYLIPSQLIVTDEINPKRSVFMQHFVLGHISYLEERKQIPNDYTIYILDSKLHWNHGMSYGAAISPEDDHIIFFFEQW